MTHQTPKAFDFGEEPEPGSDSIPVSVPDPVAPPAVPRAFDFGEDQAAEPPAADSPPRALSFDHLPPVPAATSLTRKPVATPLFESEDHPAVRDALERSRA